MKLTNILLEQNGKPKALVMAGGGGAGKSYILGKMDTKGVKQFNPDAYVEDPEHQYYKNLAAASHLVKKDVDAAVEKGKSFIWDTTGTNIDNIRKLLDEGYEVMVVMVYTHPIISFLSNFERDRSLNKATVFTTWQKAYDLIDDYRDLLGNNFFLISNLRGGEYEKKINDFNNAAKKGGDGILHYIDKIISTDPEKFKSSFSQPFDITDPEALAAYKKEIRGLDFDEDDSTIVKNLKKHFMKSWEKKGQGPGEKSMKTKLAAIIRDRSRGEEKYKAALDDIAGMITSPKYNEMLKPDKEAEVIAKANKFLK